MKSLLPFLTMTAALCLTCLDAHADCEHVPTEIQRYLKSSPGWTIVGLKSLEKGNQGLWEQYHRGECPGYAKINVDGRSSGYAVALLYYTKTGVFEKVVVVGNVPLSGSTISPAVNVKTTDVPVISVVWSAPQGRYHDLDSGRTIKVDHDVIGYEEIGAGILLYYFKNGKYHTIQTSE